MAHYETSFTTPWPVERVFDYMADFTNTTEWDANTERATCLTGDALALGARFEVVTRFGGRTMTLTYETVEFDRPRRVVLRTQAGPSEIRDTMTFVPLEGGEGTAVSYRADILPSGAAKLLDPVFHLIFQGVGRRAADGLREALDAT